ncbi:MAG TPA: hypothetical protein P5218_05715, partial [Planctomycetota bacterium]|nr:hypothetical protein [Planctomycetota bacterium]
MRTTIPWLGWFLACVPIASAFQGTAPVGYQEPPAELVDILTSPPPPPVLPSPDGHWLLLLERNALPDIREVGRRMLPLAGVRIDPRQSSPFAAVYYHTMRLRTTIPGPDQPAPITVALPAGSKIAEVQWS